MRPTKHKRLIVILAAFVLVVAVVVGLVWRLGFITPFLVQLNAPTCQDPVLTVAPTSDENIESITPLGNISLPNHALPTDHTYHVLKRGPDGLPLRTEVFSPADLVVETISFISTTRDGQTLEGDYKIDMVPCKKVSIQFDHISELSPKLAAAYAASKPKCQENKRDQDINRYCNVSMNISLSAGELIGVAGGGRPTGFDFGATDERQTSLEFANNGRYRGSSRKTACPYDLFAPALKNHFYQFLGSSEQVRTQEPRCGTIAQDIPGTAQGNWYQGNGNSDELERQGKTISLIHDNVDPTLGFLVLGSAFSKVAFIPTHSGLINREFAEIKPGQDVYCYMQDTFGSRASYGTQSPFKGSVLVRLSSATELEVEARTQDCSQAILSNSVRYIR